VPYALPEVWCQHILSPTFDVVNPKNLRLASLIQLVSVLRKPKNMSV